MFLMIFCYSSMLLRTRLPGPCRRLPQGMCRAMFFLGLKDGDAPLEQIVCSYHLGTKILELIIFPSFFLPWFLDSLESEWQQKYRICVLYKTFFKFTILMLHTCFYFPLVFSFRNHFCTAFLLVIFLRFF